MRTASSYQSLAGAAHGPRVFSRSRSVFIAFIAFLCLLLASVAAADDQGAWIRPQNAGDPLIWGRKDGILFGLPSEGGLPGPRGLVRVGVISRDTGRPQLLNFIAIEPVVLGPGRRFDRMAFSELERSNLDGGIAGKRLWVDPAADFRGVLSTVAESPKRIERLSVRIDVEQFAANGARVYLIASIDSDRPGELDLAVFQDRDSPAVEELTLTATMGNFERLRWLFLKNRVADSRVVFNGETGDAFFEHENYPLEEMLRTADGSAIALCATDEPTPSSEMNTPSTFWRYPLPRITQYWKVPARFIEPDLRVRVNGRRSYWGSHKPVPNGVAFENFELRQRYRPGQVFVFGVTPTEPWAFEPPIPHVRRPDPDSGSATKTSQPN
jgi:hypothetical protein